MLRMYGAVPLLPMFAFMARRRTFLPFVFIRTLLLRLKLNSGKYNRVLMFRILVFYDHPIVTSSFLLWSIPLNWDETIWMVS